MKTLIEKFVILQNGDIDIETTDTESEKTALVLNELEITSFTSACLVRLNNSIGPYERYEIDGVDISRIMGATAENPITVLDWTIVSKMPFSVHLRAGFKEMPRVVNHREHLKNTTITCRVFRRGRPEIVKVPRLEAIHFTSTEHKKAKPPKLLSELLNRI